MKILIVQAFCFSFLLTLLGTQARILPDYPLVRFMKTYGESSGHFYEFFLWKVVNGKSSHLQHSPASASFEPLDREQPAGSSPPSPETDPSHHQTPKIMPCTGSNPCSLQDMEAFLKLNPKSSPLSPETDLTPKIMPCTESTQCNPQAMPTFYKPPKSTPPSPETDPSHRQTPRIMPAFYKPPKPAPPSPENDPSHRQTPRTVPVISTSYENKPKHAPPSPENDPSHRQTPRTVQVISTSYENKPKHAPPPPQGAPETRQTPKILPCTASSPCSKVVEMTGYGRPARPRPASLASM